MFESRPPGPRSGPRQAHLWADVSWQSQLSACRRDRRHRRRRRPPVPGPGPLRLTRRGRQALVGLTLILTLAAAAAGILSATRAADATTNLTVTQAPHQGWRTHVVAPGETLWDLAVRFAPKTDPRETVPRLQQVNNLTSSLLPVGRVVLVPAVPSGGSTS